MRVDLIEFIKDESENIVGIPRCEEYVGLAMILNEWNSSAGSNYMTELLSNISESGEEVTIGSEGDEYSIVLSDQSIISTRFNWDVVSQSKVAAHVFKLDTSEVISTIHFWCKCVLSNEIPS